MIFSRAVRDQKKPGTRETGPGPGPRLSFTLDQGWRQFVFSKSVNGKTVKTVKKTGKTVNGKTVNFFIENYPFKATIQ